MDMTSPTARICVPRWSETPFELLEGPARELDDDVIAVRIVLVERAVLAAGNLVERQATREYGRRPARWESPWPWRQSADEREVRGLISMMMSRGRSPGHAPTRRWCCR